jgi:hypothetical protein
MTFLLLFPSLSKCLLELLQLGSALTFKCHKDSEIYKSYKSLSTTHGF